VELFAALRVPGFYHPSAAFANGCHRSQKRTFSENHSPPIEDLQKAMKKGDEGFLKTVIILVATLIAVPLVLMPQLFLTLRLGG